MWFDMVKRYYDLGFYTTEQVKIFVKSHYITELEYKTITNIEYVI